MKVKFRQWIQVEQIVEVNISQELFNKAWELYIKTHGVEPTLKDVANCILEDPTAPDDCGSIEFLTYNKATADGKFNTVEERILYEEWIDEIRKAGGIT